jgi:energy-coupling factor transporter ATP-binding protein EcfA2
MLSKVHIQNFKSIVDEQIELGAFNVFIGANGSGKTNVLEAVGMAVATAMSRLTAEELFNLGIRVTRPNLMATAFLPGTPRMELTLSFDNPNLGEPITYRLLLEEAENPATTWLTTQGLRLQRDVVPEAMAAVIDNLPEELRAQVSDVLKPFFYLAHEIHSFAIYSPSTLALRGLEVTSRREPLGLYGENLDVTLARLPESDLVRRASSTSSSTSPSSWRPAPPRSSPSTTSRRRSTPGCVASSPGRSQPWPSSAASRRW